MKNKSEKSLQHRRSTGADSSASPVTKLIKPDEALSQAEGLKRFKELDRLIVSGLSQSLVVSRALSEMERGQYYTFGGFKTIAEYGCKIMKLAQSTVHQYVKAGHVAKLIEDSTDCRVKPVNQAQLRPLLSVDDDAKVIEIWNAAVTLNGEGGLTEKAVARAKRQVLKQEHSKPKDINAEEVAKKLHQAIRRGWDACQGERGKLLDNLLLVLKGFYDEMNYDERSPRLTAIFNHVGVEAPTPLANATAVSDSTQPAPTADVSIPPPGAAASPIAANKTPAKPVTPQTRQKTKQTTVGDHLSKLRGGFDSIAAELLQCQEKWPKNLQNSARYLAGGNAIQSLDVATKQLAQIVVKVGVTGDLPFSTDILPRGSRLKRVQRMT